MGEDELNRVFNLKGYDLIQERLYPKFIQIQELEVRLIEEEEL